MEEKITLANLAGLIADASGMKKRDTEVFLKTLFAVVSNALAEGDSVKLRGIGSFKLQTVKPRKSVDVTTGEEIRIETHSKVVFTPDKELAQAVNAPFEMFESVELAEDLSDDMLSGVSEESSAELSFENIEETTDNDPIELPEEDSVLVEDEHLTEQIGNTDDNSNEVLSSGIFTTEESPETIEVTEEIIETPESNISYEDNASGDNCKDEEPNVSESPVLIKERRFPSWLWFVAGFFSAFVLGLVFVVLVRMDVFAPVEAESEMNVDRTDISTKPAMDKKVAMISDSNVLDTISDADIKQGNTSFPDTKPSDTPRRYDTVTKTRYLTTMSREYYGNYHFWPYIYEENKDILGHPDRIRPGTKVVIPDLSKYGVDPKSPEDLKIAKQKGVAIYKRYNK